jgi:hypothetical protein
MQQSKYDPPEGCRGGFGASGDRVPCINADFGVSIRSKGGTAEAIFRYKEEWPPVFRNSFGQPVSEDVARAAGFDVDGIRAGFTGGPMQALEPRTVDRRGDYEIQDYGLGRFVVVQGSGKHITPQPVTRTVAVALLDKLVGADAN